MIRALIREGYWVSFVDGVLPKDRIPREWWKEGQTEDISIEIEGKQQTLAAAGYMILLATNKVTGKHICLTFLWPYFEAPELDPFFVFYHAQSIDYWWALVRTYIIDPDTLAGLIGLRFLTVDIKSNIEAMNSWMGSQGIFKQREFCDPIRKQKAAGNLEIEDEDDEIYANEQLSHDEEIALLEDDEDFIAYLTQSAELED